MLRKRQDRLFNLSSTCSAFWVWMAAFRRNPAFEHILGFPPEQLPGRALLDFSTVETSSPRSNSFASWKASRSVLRESQPVCGRTSGGSPGASTRCERGNSPPMRWRTTLPAAGSRDALLTEYAFRKSMEESLVTGMRD